MSQRKKHSKKREHKVLEGYTKNGSKFSLFPGNTITPVSYVESGIPELIWLALLQKEVGLKRAVEIVEKIASEFGSETDQEKPLLFLVTQLGNLNSEKQEKINQKLKSCDMLSDVEKSLSIFASIYEEFPLRWLTKPPSAEGDHAWLQEFKSLLAELQDKTSVLAVQMIALGVFGCVTSGALKVPDGMLGDLNEIINYPNTEESLSLAARLRALLIGVIGQYSVSPASKDWASYFWKRGFELEPIDYQNLLRGKR
ncbi:hypothetical protein KA183_08520 [bacterium]|nr:hypothetical protein [bacterium]